MARNEKRKKITYVFFSYMKYSKLWSAEFSWAQTSYFWRVTVKYRQLFSCSNVISFSISILNNEKNLGYPMLCEQNEKTLKCRQYYGEMKISK